MYERIRKQLPRTYVRTYTCYTAGRARVVALGSTKVLTGARPENL